MANLRAVPTALVTPPPILQTAAVRTTAGARPVAVRVEGLRKCYGRVEAVAGLTFEIHAGEVFGLLGPNGAGKTTTISVLATQLRPTAGDAVIFGHSLRDGVSGVRRLIGVVPQEVALYPMLTAVENIKFFGRMYDVPKVELEHRVDELLQLVGLDARRHDSVQTFSGGMKRRLNLAVSLVHRPKLLLLDEPTVGVDPHSREHIFQIVHRLRDAGTAILYTTHYMEEAERLCDRLGIMDEGKIIALGTLDVLLAELGCAEVIEIRGLPPNADVSALQAAVGVCRAESHDGVTRLFVTSAARVLAPLHQAISRYPERVHVQIAPLSLENLFLQLTGKELRD
jgi:linearmycin/streptolysin S transport system ATP-binding protein